MSEPLKVIREVSSRPSVEVHLLDGTVLQGPRGSQLATFLKDLDGLPGPVVGAIVNRELRELTYSIDLDARVRPVTMAESDGMRIYRRSLTFLLAAAFEELFPDKRLTVDHSVFSGGYYCEVLGEDSLLESDLEKLAGRMRVMVEEDLPFAKSHVPIEDAIQYFETKGQNDKVRLLSHRRKPYLVFYEVNEHRDYHHGYMVPSTGYLQWFELTAIGSGFVLRFPRRSTPTEVQPMAERLILLEAFSLYGDWLAKLGVDSVGALNDAIESDRAREVILVGEALHARRITEIAGRIAQRSDEIRVVLIAGPSSSGKTTFSKRLSIQLLANGIAPLPIELDNYFVNRDETPLDENGEYDFESIHALNLERLNHDLRLLADGQEVQMPKYDFKKGMSVEGEVVRLFPGQIVILEGIHGLNPELVPELPKEVAYRIYISALTQLNLDYYNRASTADTRLIRRIVRDASHRGYGATATINRWESVRRGEARWIFPFDVYADAVFNSALVYEGAALAPLAEPLLRQVEYGTEEHVEAKRLLAFLEWFRPIDRTLVPDDSILREFIGGSILREFSPLYHYEQD